jgi:LysM repeat protein
MKKFLVIIFTLLAISTPAYFCNALSITSFTPIYGGVDTEVTITGTDFYKIDGVQVDSIPVPTSDFRVLNSSTIVFKVPAGFTDGQIIVLSKDNNNQTVKNYSKDRFKKPEISFPLSGNIGDEITISSISNILGTDMVFFGGVSAIPKSNSYNAIMVNVPEGAKTGKIVLRTTRYGDIVSSSEFKVGSESIVPTINYTIISGDTLTKIANKFNTTVSNLQKLNNILDANINKIEVGDILLVPNTPVGNIDNKDTTYKASNTNTSSYDGKGLVPDCNSGEVDPVTGNYTNPCNFNVVMSLINKVINFVLVTLATPLFALIMIYVGYLYLTASGNSENINLAKKILKNAVFGYIIALIAWLLVKTILTTLGFQAGEEAQFFDYLK